MVGTYIPLPPNSKLPLFSTPPLTEEQEFERKYIKSHMTYLVHKIIQSIKQDFRGTLSINIISYTLFEREAVVWTSLRSPPTPPPWLVSFISSFAELGSLLGLPFLASESQGTGAVVLKTRIPKSQLRNVKTLF